MLITVQWYIVFVNLFREQVNWNVFKFVINSPRAMIKATGRTVRGQQLFDSVQTFINNLQIACDNLFTTTTTTTKTTTCTTKTLPENGRLVWSCILFC